MIFVLIHALMIKGSVYGNGNEKGATLPAELNVVPFGVTI